MDFHDSLSIATNQLFLFYVHCKSHRRSFRTENFQSSYKMECMLCDTYRRTNMRISFSCNQPIDDNEYSKKCGSMRLTYSGVAMKIPSNLLT